MTYPNYSVAIFENKNEALRTFSSMSLAPYLPKICDGDLYIIPAPWRLCPPYILHHLNQVKRYA